MPVLARTPLIKSAGFTLLELLTTLAIVGLLMAVSYSTYTHHVVKARRAQGAVALLSLASALEHHHAIKNTYKGAALADLQVNEYTDGKAYRLEIGRAADNHYLVSAVPQGAQKADKLCGILSLDEVGSRGITGIGKATDCW